MSENTDQDALITQLSQATGLEPQMATQFLIANSWNIEAAASNYYASLDEPADAGEDPSSSQPQQPASGARTLDGSFVPEPQPIPTTSSAAPPSASNSSQARKKFATLGDLVGGGSAGHAHDHDSDDDDGDDQQDLFAGGEKSGLAVQNPDDIKKKIMDKARRNAPRPGGDDSQPQQSNFRGAARTLGGDDAPSRVIEDPDADLPKPRERVERHLHFWSNGFSVDDGPLYSNEDPQNAQMLNMIQRGKAPLAIMDVTPDQEVDVKLEPHDGPYVQPKKKYKPFEGGGQRLGSPTPGITPTPSSSSQATSTPPLAASASTQPAISSLDSSQPAISLQIRLGDGTRLVSRFNLTHTIGDVYDFVRASNVASQTRNWVLMTTFPSKEMSDQGTLLEDTPELKKGGTVIQKWT